MVVEKEKSNRNICIVQKIKSGKKTLVDAFGNKQKVYEYLRSLGTVYLNEWSETGMSLGKQVKSYETFCLKLRTEGSMIVHVATMGNMEGTFEVAITTLK